MAPRCRRLTFQIGLRVDALLETPATSSAHHPESGPPAVSTYLPCSPTQMACGLALLALHMVRNRLSSRFTLQSTFQDASGGLRVDEGEGGILIRTASLHPDRTSKGKRGSGLVADVIRF